MKSNDIPGVRILASDPSVCPIAYTAASCGGQIQEVKSCKASEGDKPIPHGALLFGPGGLDRPPRPNRNQNIVRVTSLVF